MADYPPLLMGCDPGKLGGLAFLSLNIASPFAAAFKMPETRRDLIELIGEYHGNGTGKLVSIAYIERVRSSPQMGNVSAFSFGCNYERVVMACMCAGIAVEEVIPQRWQKALGCLTHGDKHVSKARAQSLFPNLKITNATADCLLIAHYGRLQLHVS